VSKENALRYHQRVMDEYIQARYIHKGDALNEAADVLFSNTNLENYGYASPPYIPLIEDYLRKAVEIERTAQDGDIGAATANEDAYGERRTVSDRAWRRMFREGHAGAQTGMGIRHPRKMKDVLYGQLSSEDPAVKKKCYQRMFRWRGNSSEDRMQGVPSKHKAHHLAKLGFFNRPTANANLHSNTPLAFNLIQDLYHRRRGKLDEKMLEAEKHMPKSAKSNLMLGPWGDEGVTHEKMREAAYKRYCTNHKEHFPQAETPGEREFFHHKMYEMKGIPHEQLFESDLYDQDTGQCVYGDISHMVKQNRHREMGLLPVMLGITMLDYDDQIKVMEWVANGGGSQSKTDEKGNKTYTATKSFDDSLLDEAFGPGAQHPRGFMTRNLKLFSKALHQLYSGFPGSSHAGTVAGRPSDMKMEGFQDPFKKLNFGEDGWERVAGPNSIEARRANFIKDPESVDSAWKNQGIDIDQDRYDEMVEEAIGATKAQQVRDVMKIKHKGKLPKIPDFDNAVKLGIITAEEAEDAQHYIVASVNHQISTAENFGMLEHYNHTHKLTDHNFDPSQEPEYEATCLDEMVHGLNNGMGSLSREFYEIAEALHEGLPGVLFTDFAKQVDPKIFPTRGIPDKRGNWKGNKPLTQSWQYTDDMSRGERIEHNKSLRRWMNENRETQDAIKQAEEKLANGERVELEAYPSRPDGKSQTQSTREAMKLRFLAEGDKDEEILDEDESQDEWEHSLKGSPTLYPAAPGLNFLGALLPYNTDFPMGGILSAEVKTGRTDNNYSYHPMSRDRAHRLNAIKKKNDGRTFHSQGMLTELENATKKRTPYHHTYNTNMTVQHTLEMLARKNLLFANAHHHPSVHDEKHHEEWKQRLANPKSILTSKDHKDVLGRPDADMAAELLGNEPYEDYGIGVYDSDQYQKSMDAHTAKGGIMRLKPLTDKSLAGFGELSEFIQLRYVDAKGTPFAKLSPKLQQEILYDARQGQLDGRYINDDEEIKSFKTGPSPQQHYDYACRNLREQISEAMKAGKEDIADILTSRLHEQMAYSHKTIGHNPTPTPHEQQHYETEHATQTHNATKLAYQTIFKPLIENIRPSAFKTGTARENNQTHANLTVAYNISERFMRNKSPEERREFLEHGHLSGLGDEGGPITIKVSDYVDEDAIKKIVEYTVPRMTFKIGTDDLPNAREHFAPLESKGEKPTGGHVFEAFINGKIGNQDPELTKEYKIAQAVLERVQAVSKDKNSNEELMNRLYARYIPHGNESGEPVEHKMVDNRMGDHNHDAMHTSLNEDGEKIFTPLMSGGEGVHQYEVGMKKNANISQKTEIKALDAVLKDIKSQTQGTPYCVNLRNQFAFMPFGQRKFKKLPKRLAEVFEDLAKPTEIKGESKAAPAELTQVEVGGRHPSRAPLPAIADCLASKDQMGTIINPQFTIRDQHPTQMMLDNPQRPHFHQAPPSSVGYVSPDLLKDAHEGLNNYDDTIYQPHETQPLQVSQEQERAGDGVNTTMQSGQAALDAGANSSNEYFQMCADRVTDDTLIIKDDGRPTPIKSMHRIFDLSDLKHLRGFSGDWIASHIPKGEPIILQKKGKKTKAYNADMKLVELSSDMQEEMGKVNDKDFVVHAVIGDDMLYFIDLLEAADEKTHNMPAKDRVRHLRAHFESSVHIKMPEPYNTKRADDTGLAEAVSLLRDESPSDILLRDASTTYMRGEIRHPKWVLLSKEKRVDVIILDRKGATYRIGVGPIMHPEHYGARSVEYEGQHYMDIGSAKGPRGFDKGEYVSVFCTGVSCNQSEYPVFTIRSARIDRDSHPQAADSVESLSIMTNDSKVPHKARLKKGRLHIIFPSLHDEVIYKINREEQGWMIEAEKSMWGDDDYLFKLAEDVRPYWQPIATVLLKREEEKEVEPEVPAGHTKKRKQILSEEEEIIKRGLQVLERSLERLSKEKITSTGVQGLGLDYGDADVESPRGPTTNMNDDTLPDFDPASREYKEKPAETNKKPTRIRTTEGEEATTDNRGNITITKPRV